MEKTLTISNGSKDRCRTYFGYKGIGKLINRACNLLETVDIGVIVSEFICDYDDSMLYNILLFLIRENCHDDSIIDELETFNYVEL